MIFANSPKREPGASEAKGNHLMNFTQGSVRKNNPDFLAGRVVVHSLPHTRRSHVWFTDAKQNLRTLEPQEKRQFHLLQKEMRG